ncbi:MAG: 1-(5-phosphoribosyl)-5-[(5-phosphoribosylamino)methylideneamino]imidazole-4-carboxamide isomerase [Chloroflexi bacterium]|nr:1-(5-phosphoribosyl)-5-[(5-phosphoribosylamino)methylideneamino]imidazole-4-carboxamide isomerase [Chloroflexota bacterium]
MEIIPSIDLLNGKCVRLYQGDYSKETIYSDDPVAIAIKWASYGAERLHLVDLDGAKKGKIENINVIKNIISSTKLKVELGGGIRTFETIKELLNIGLDRVILGTIAVENPALVKKACASFADKIIIGIDARKGLVATRGWQTNTTITAIDLVNKMEKLGAKRFIYTDISRDGTLTEPNYEALKELIQKTGKPVIASGGISSIDQLKYLSIIGTEGAIIGQALYTGKIDLKEALDLYKTETKQITSEGHSMLKFDDKGLIPAIIQDFETSEVLMLGYINKESLELTITNGKVCFWSRSRKELWQKGDTSGNFLKVRQILRDCDEDALLIKVNPAGPVCHTGNRSCFYSELEK